MIDIDKRKIEEWHKYILAQRNSFKNTLEYIASGVCPKIVGMASDYRKLTLKECIDTARRALGRA